MAAQKKNKNKEVHTKKAAKLTKTASHDYISSNFWRKNWIPALIVFATALALYFSTISFDYVLDDKIVYTKNNFVKKGFQGTWDILSKESFVGYFGEQKELVAGGRYRPLSIVSFAWEYGLFGKHKNIDFSDPVSVNKIKKYSHFFNALFYAFSCLLLYRVLCFMFYEDEKNKKWFLSIAFIAAMFFVVHPLHTEVVANVKGRDEILALMGALSAIYFAYRYLIKGSIFALVLSGICFFLGALSKENTLMFVALIPATFWYFTKADLKKIFIASLPAFIAAFAFLIVRFQVVGFGFGKEVVELMNNPFAGMNAGEKSATIFYTLGVYLKLLFFPHPLTHDYYPYHIPKSTWSNIIPLVSLLAHVILIGIAFLGIKKKSVISYCIFLYLITLFITSNILFPIGTFMNERFIYMSSLGFCIFAAWFLNGYLQNKIGDKGQIIALGLSGILIAAFAIKTIIRVPDWKSRMSLNKAAIQVSPNSARANLFMCTALFELEYQKTDDVALKKDLLSKMTFYIDKALHIYPEYGSALTMQAGVITERYRYDRDLDLLLADFTRILKKKGNESHIYRYCEYLNKRATDTSTSKLINFYYNIGTYFADSRNAKVLAKKYFSLGLQVAPSNPQLKQALQRVAN